MTIGVILILVAIVWFLQTLGLVDSSIWNIILPLILFYLGFMMVSKHCDSDGMVCDVKKIMVTDKKPVVKTKKKVVKKIKK